MIAHYIVTNETHKVMMILRPYQYFTTEAIIHQVKTLTITLTFGTPQVQLNLFQCKPDCDGIARRVQSRFVVDRKDLDYQTMTEFNASKRQC
jgi:type I restriction enzyme R subunit